MSNNQQAFFALVRAGLWEKDVLLSHIGGIDFNEVYRLAEEQSVIGLVAAGIEHIVDVKAPRDVVLQFVGQTLRLEHNNLSMNKFISVLIDKMRGADIYALLLKGQGLAQCYERPLWRAAGDVDLFLNDDSYQKAKRYLQPYAFSIDPEGDYSKHLGMTIDHWTVELHGSLRCGLSNKIDRELDRIYNDTFFKGAVRSWDNNGAIIYQLNVENDIIYVFTHFLNHYYKGGIGIRQICDWCRLLWVYKETINLNYLQDELQKMRLITAWRAFASFSVEYLGIPSDSMPFYDTSRVLKKKAKRIREFILMSGNFGHNRDSSYYSKYPYIIRKMFSFIRRCGDLLRNALILPYDSLRFFPSITIKGIKSTARGE